MGTLMKKVINRGPTIFFIQNNMNDLFGGFASISWKKYNHYYGNGRNLLLNLLESFVFKIDDLNDIPIVYHWSKSNHMFQFCNDKIFGMGGGYYYNYPRETGFALNLDENLDVCISNKCKVLTKY